MSGRVSSFSGPRGRIGPPTGPVFGEPIITISVEIDKAGTMRTTIKPTLTTVQVISIFEDLLHAQVGMLVQQQSLLIDPNRRIIKIDEPDEGTSKAQNVNETQAQENHNGGGRDPGGDPATG